MSAEIVQSNQYMKIIMPSNNEYYFPNTYIFSLINSNNHVSGSEYSLQQVTDYAYSKMINAKSNRAREKQRKEREKGIEANLELLRNLTGRYYTYENGQIIHYAQYDHPETKARFDKALECYLASCHAYQTSHPENSNHMQNVINALSSNQDPLSMFINAPLENGYGLPSSQYLSAYNQADLTAEQRKAVLYDISTNKVLGIAQTIKNNMERYNNIHARSLFKGQQNHLMTESELNQVLLKMDIQMSDPQKKETIIRSLRKMAEYPTGRKQLRQIINSPIQRFRIECSPETDAICMQYRGGGFYDGKRIAIHSKYFRGNDVEINIGYSLLHELLHNRQITFPNRMLADMETQALDAQMRFEMNCVGNQSYNESYNKNYQDWEEILAGKRAKPAWAPAFEPIDNLTPEQLQDAQKAYIQQMASLTTQAQFMEDFVISHQSMRQGDFSMPVPDYNNINHHLFYDSHSILQKNCDFTITPEITAYLQKNYPALNISKVQFNAAALTFEHKNPNTCIMYRGENRPISFKHTDAYAEAHKHPIYQQLNRIQGRTYNETARLRFDLIKNSDMGQNGKLYLISDIIDEHKNKYPDLNTPEGMQRKQMIIELREMTGFSKLPIVQNGTLHSNAQPVASDLETPEEEMNIISKQTSGKDIA